MEAGIFHEAELEPEARLGDQRAAHAIALMTGHDHGLANTGQLQRAQNAHHERNLRD